MEDKGKAMLIMALCAVMWSMGGIFIKLISWSPLLISGVRSLISAAVMGCFMAYMKVPVNICRYSAGAGIGLSASCLLFVMATKLTTSANAVVLQYSAPVFILVISVLFLKQRLHRKELLTVLLTMAGIILFFFDQLSPGNFLGNIFGILSGLTLAVMFVMVGLGRKDDSIRMSGILLAHIITAVIGIPLGLTATASCSGLDILYIIILGLFQLGIPYVLYSVASKSCPPLACSLIGMLEPLLNPVWVAIFVGELPGPFALLGGAMIIGVVTWWCVQESKAPSD